jgi:hypothetical protein
MAPERLVPLGLDRPSHERLEGRWNVQWSTSWTVEGENDTRRHILYQRCLAMFF